MTNSVMVASNLLPGQVTSRFISWGDSLVRAVELEAKDADNMQTGGEHPWSIQDGGSATMLMFNHSAARKKVRASIAAEGVMWQETYTLASMETRALSINDVIAQRIPDHIGHVLPAKATSGTGSWAGTRKEPATGRMLISNPQIGLARNYACGTCPHMCGGGGGFSFLNTYSSLTGGIGSDYPLGYVTVYECTGCTRQCGGPKDGNLDVYDSFDYSWGNNNVVSTTSGDVSMASYTVNAAGSSSIMYMAQIPDELPPCQAPGNAPTTGITATVTLNSTGSVSSDDSALPTYRSTEGTTSLGPIIASGTTQGCFIGTEAVGHIVPSTYAGTVIMHRWLLNDAYYKYSTLLSQVQTPGMDDTSNPSFRDDNPQSGGSGGRVYDLDAPGISSPDLNTYRLRSNFYAWAALPDGTRVSPFYNYYIRVSCAWNGAQYVFRNDVPNDNQIGVGTTLTSWNLQ